MYWAASCPTVRAAPAQRVLQAWPDQDWQALPPAAQDCCGCAGMYSMGAWFVSKSLVALPFQVRPHAHKCSALPAPGGPDGRACAGRIHLRLLGVLHASVAAALLHGCSRPTRCPARRR